VGWIEDAKRTTEYIIEPAFVVDEENQRAYPCVAFAFRHGVNEEENPPIFLSFVGTPATLMKLKRDVNRAIDDSIKRAAKKRNELS
jgi:hypothetical protein